MISSCHIYFNVLGALRALFAGGVLTEGQHRPKAGKKKKTREAGLFFLVPTSPRCFIRKWVNPTFPDL